MQKMIKFNYIENLKTIANGNVAITESDDSALNEKIEQELEKKGIYAEVKPQTKTEDKKSDQPLDEDFQKYDWEDGSITGDGLIQLISDTDKYSRKNAIKIYDRQAGKYYDIVDYFIDRKNSGLMLEINTSRESLRKKALTT